MFHSSPRCICQQSPDGSRRGTALVLAVVLMFVLFSFLAFSIDIGYVSQAGAEVRRTADAAALAGCWELYEQLETGSTAEQVHPQIREASAVIAAANPVCRQHPDVDASDSSSEITIGYVPDLHTRTISSDDSDPYYAVRVKVNRSSARNGEIPYFFGRIFGDTGIDMAAESTAVFARQISGFSVPSSSASHLNILPFALDLQTWNELLANQTPDEYSYDAITGDVTSGTDGIREVNLYPQGTGSPGNRGTVDIGGSNNSTNDIARQIVHGISEADMLELGKPLYLDDSNTLTLNGDTGISAGVKDELASIIGQKRIIPIYSSVSGSGNNATYTIAKWAGVRILDVKLTGKMSGKRLTVQPAATLAPYGIVATSGSEWSDFVLSPVILAD